MTCPLPVRARYAVIGLCFFFPLFATQVVAGEIFKCVAKDGGPLYQNFPCHIDSIGSLPSNPPLATTPSMLGAAGQEKSKSVSIDSTSTVKSASTIKSNGRVELSIGMTTDEVRALLGEPVEMVADEPESGGPISTWRYADGRSLQFDHKHRLLEVQVQR